MQGETDAKNNETADHFLYHRCSSNYYVFLDLRLGKVNYPNRIGRMGRIHYRWFYGVCLLCSKRKKEVYPTTAAYIDWFHRDNGLPSGIGANH